MMKWPIPTWKQQAFRQDIVTKGQLRSQHLRVDKKFKLVLMPRSPEREHQLLECTAFQRSYFDLTSSKSLFASRPATWMTMVYDRSFANIGCLNRCDKFSGQDQQPVRQEPEMLPAS